MLKGCRCLCYKIKPLTARSIRSLSSETYDVVVSGGGMVGTATAAALGKHSLLSNKKILLLEASPETEYQTPLTFSNRVSALSPASRRFLQEIGAWSIIESSGRYKPVESMYVWEACSEAKIRFNKSAESEDHLAYLVENDLTVHALKSSVRECSHTVEVANNTTVTKYEKGETSGDLMRIHLNNGDVISTRLVIGADGFNSLARRSADIETVSWNYDQVGVVSTLKLNTEDGNRTAWQRFLPSGPIAILPLSEDTSSLVWSTSPSHAKHLLSLSPEVFVDELNQALTDNSKSDSFVAGIVDQYKQFLHTWAPDAVTATKSSQPHLPPTIIDIDTNSRAMFPYGMMHAERFVASRLALVGDSCHRIHPLAGQGVNLGFGDAESLVKVIIGAAERGADIGWLDHLVEYETNRQPHVIAISAGIEGLYRLYSNDWTPVVLARSLGLMTVNSLSQVKNFFQKHAQA